MPKPPRPVALVGRGQDDRAKAQTAAPRQAEGPRTLQGAMNVPIEQIAPDPDQPRRAIDDEGLRDLAASMTEYGVLQPLLVREDGYLNDERARYMIIAGGRRYAAALLAGLTRLPVVVRDTEGATLRLTQLIENVQRQDLAPLDEARAFKELMDAEGLDAVALGKRLHVTGQHVRDRLLLLTDEVVAGAVQRQQVAPTVAREVLRLPKESRAQLRDRITAGEHVDHADVKAAKKRDTASGVVNPRAKGGGRAQRSASASTDTASLPGAPTAEQTLFVPALAPDAQTPPHVPAASAEAALIAVVAAREAGVFEDALQYGVARQWNCAELLAAVQQRRAESERVARVRD